jgi:hypothetical protein
MIAQIAEPLQAVLDVKEPRLPTIARSKLRSHWSTIQAIKPSSNQGLRTVHMHRAVWLTQRRAALA